MRQVAITAVVAVSLSGCAFLKNVSDDATLIAGTTVSPNEVYILDNTFVAAEATANNYLQLPLCPQKTVICRSTQGTNVIVIAVRNARDAMTKLLAATLPPAGSPAGTAPTPAPVGLYTTASTAFTALKSAITQYQTQT